MYVWGQEVYENSLYFLLNFAIKQKTTLKTKFILKIVCVETLEQNGP